MQNDKLASTQSSDTSAVPQRQEGWRPIETAPKDGRELMLMVEKRAGESHCTLVGHWMPGGHCIEDHPPIETGWYFFNGCMFDLASKPTHWMPLPVGACPRRKTGAFVTIFSAVAGKVAGLPFIQITKGDSVTTIPAAIAAFFNFLCTPAGQQFATDQNKLGEKLGGQIADFVDHIHAQLSKPAPTTGS